MKIIHYRIMNTWKEDVVLIKSNNTWHFAVTGKEDKNRSYSNYRSDLALKIKSIVFQNFFQYQNIDNKFKEQFPAMRW